MLTFHEFLLEHGNPLARLKTHIDNDRHFIGLSAERGDLTASQNRDRMTELKNKIRSQGYGFKRAKGQWEGGSENSLIVHAKAPGREAGAALLKDMKKHSKDYGQDAIFHHNGQTGKLIGTNDTGYPGQGKTVTTGRVSYNNKEAPFQTELRASKTKSSARFTTTKE